ncbi:alpha/beta hydrolase [Tetragenococcus solitarius]|uniref:Alpha/beta hydrolase n=1 Tax=Tetragenococcus solitarius TaxID=71453 RepID=A0ABP6KM93_9ENTE
MPKPTQPELKKWLVQLNEQIPILDEKTYLVTHSLGGLTTLHYLTQKFQQDSRARIGGLLLVSGFYEKREGMSSPEDFFEGSIDFNAIKKGTNGNITVVSSANDYIVPTELTDQLARKLNGNYYRKKESGHFLATDGYVEFPLLLSLLTNLVEQENHGS